MENKYKYARLTQGVKDFGKLYPIASLVDHITDSEKDWYESIYFYNDEHLATFKKVGSIRGIKDVVTNKLVFDFDCEADPDFARKEARTLVYRLVQAGIPENAIQIFFSGNKGFNVIVELDRYMTPDEHAACATRFTNDLNMDLSLYDAPQLLRIVGTKHPKSKLYKIPLTITQFYNDSLEEIKRLASDPSLLGDTFDANIASLPDAYFEVKEKPKLMELVQLGEYRVSLADKPRYWKNCKWSILQGNFKAGERHEALLILAATCRGLGYDKETTYYMCKSALKKQAARSKQEDFPKEELWENIIETTVFGPNWNGGQYSCKNNLWLNRYCKSLGNLQCTDREEVKSSVKFEDMDRLFGEYATNYESNIIKTGIDELDENCTFLASTLVGLLGQPGAGKTSLAINYLKNTSANNIPAMFFSLDMGLPIVYGKLIQKVKGIPFKDALSLWKKGGKERETVYEKLRSDYKNTSFNFLSGLSVPDIKTQILEEQEATQRKIKLVVVDYLECLAGPFSDSTANSGFIANQLKDLANDLNVCVLLLLQTQKHSTPDVSDPLLSLKGVKGSSVIEQSCSTILTLWREGYHPDTVNNDKFISFAVVKNRFGPLWKSDFSWNGITGDIGSLTDEGRLDLKHLKEEKVRLKAIMLSGSDKDWDK